MTLRPPPGVQLSTGRLRVDAGRAIAKLRAYQLVDRIGWVLEGIRAAVACGAVEIQLTGDANDVWLRWTGEPLPPDELARLFDELVSPEPTADRHGVRLLAAAVNSALGLAPAYVEVIAIDESTAACVRYTPDVLEEPATELGESRLHQLEVTAIARAPEAARGMLVHLRRRATLDVVQNFFRGEPPELHVARAHCHTITAPLKIGDRTFDGRELGSDILRVALGNSLDGFIAIVDPEARTAAFAGAIVEVAECGVVLQTFEDAFGLISPRAPLPIRVVIDAPKLPTNASRSEVRRDQHPIITGLRRARELLPELVGQLVRAVSAETVEPRARTAAIALLAAYIGGEAWKDAAGHLQGPLAALADVPLLFNAIGDKRSVRAGWRWTSTYYTGGQPLPRDLAPWLEDILWVPPSDPASRLVPGSTSELMSTHVRWARRQLRTRHRFLRHAPREPRVIDRREPLVRATIGASIPNSCVPARVFEGLTGEVCLYASGGGELRILLEGRELDRELYDSPIGFSAVIESPQIRADDRYRSAVRDLAFAFVERAMRAQVLRAIEALAATGLGEALPEGIEIPRALDAMRELPLVRHGLELASELGARISPPLSRIALWVTADGRRHTLDELRTHPTLGITTARPQVANVPLGIPLVCVSDDVAARQLAHLLRTTLITYAPDQLAHVSTARSLAAVVGRPDAHVLEFHDTDLHGVIAAANGSGRIIVLHRGMRLAEHPHETTLLPCTIVVEASTVIPARDWTSLADDRGLRERDFRRWEVELLRAAAHALVGERPPALLGPPVLTLTSELSRALFQALTRTDPRELLGEELIAKLRTQPLLVVNGASRLHSIDELAIAFPDDLPYLPASTEPIAEFAPLVASHEIAHGIAALLGREARDARVEVERRRLELARALRIVAHRARAVEQLALPGGGPGLEVTTTVGRAVLGLGRDRFELRLHVEGRLFQIVTLDEVPLRAVIDLGIEAVDATFEAIPAERVANLAYALRERTPALLVALAKARADLPNDPDALALAAAWASRRGELPEEVRAELAARLVFRTVRGSDEAVHATDPVRVAAWRGDWIAPASGEPPDALDAQVLHVPEGATQLRAFIEAVAGQPIVDVTREVSRLQTRRQMARGLVPTPRAQTPPHLTRSLASFGETARPLGEGEIGLVEGPSFLRVHIGGELRELVPIDVVPGVHVAIDAAFIAEHERVQAPLPADTMAALDQVRSLVASSRVSSLTRPLQAIARELARVVLRTVPHAQLSPEIRRVLRRAVLSGAVKLQGVAEDVPLFPTNTGAWATARDLEAQRARFEAVWSIPERKGALRPLDDARIVLVLPREELTLESAHDLGIIDATRELELDAAARVNRARIRPATLELSSDGILAKVELGGDGVTSPRGVVGLLHPSNASRRGIHAHRELHPFDRTHDVCAWPTIAMVDDARITPDRTWALPVGDEIYKELEAAITEASETAWRRLLSPPPNALASIEITQALLDVIPAPLPSTLQLRGVVWLESASSANRVAIVHNFGDHFVDFKVGGLGGRLYTYAPEGRIGGTLYPPLLEELYTRLARQLADAGPLDDDAVLAHVAEALALGRMAAAQVPTFAFPCFAPVPLSSEQLVTLLRGRAPVRLGAPDVRHPVALVDDGSETFRVLSKRLASRLDDGARPEVLRPILDLPRVERTPRAPPKQPAPPHHPLQGFVDAMQQRLTSLGVHVEAWTLRDDREKPLVRYRAPTVELATSNASLIAIAAAHAASSPWAAEATDLLVAHVITVLNAERAAITDGVETAALAQLLVQRR